MSEKLRLRGTARNRLDAKGRFPIPAKWREDLGEAVTVTSGHEKCLYIYRKKDYDDLEDKLSEVRFYSDERARQTIRNLLSDGLDCVPDKQGRILLNNDLRKHAGLNQEMEVLVKGVGDHLEIWNEEVWNAYNEGFSLEESSKSLAQYGL